MKVLFLLLALALAIKPFKWGPRTIQPLFFEYVSRVVWEDATKAYFAFPDTPIVTLDMATCQEMRDFLHALRDHAQASEFKDKLQFDIDPIGDDLPVEDGEILRWETGEQIMTYVRELRKNQFTLEQRMYIVDHHVFTRTCDENHVVVEEGD